MTQVREAIGEACHAGLQRLDAQILLLHALDRPRHDRAWLIAHDQDELDATALQRYRTLCAQRGDAVPLAYLVGWRAFYGLDLRVDPRVLDPRPDTEALVDWALSLPGLPPHACVADLGTGSGAVALALKSQRPQWQVHACDASPAALQVASANASRLGYALPLHLGHWLRALPAHLRLDLIVANPPYLRVHDPHLAALRHEPPQALVAGPDGLQALREIIGSAGAWLQPGGWLLLEHGHDQGAPVRDLLQAGGFADIQSRKDLAGIERCSGGWHAGQPAL